jgi:CPA2 family monovalent cation:H+ antiporter-2
MRLLRDNEVEPTVIEMNLETVHHLRAEGVAAVYGDASHSETLKAAGVDRAATLILSASGIRGAEEMIRVARELNPRVRVLVRSAYLRERPALSKAGADEVFSGEGEVALAMTESVLRSLGAIAEQIDRERARVRADLFGAPTAPEANEPHDKQTVEPSPSPSPAGQPEVLVGDPPSAAAEARSDPEMGDPGNSQPGKT